MAMQEIEKSNKEQVDSKDLGKIDVKDLTQQEAGERATDIVNDPNNVEQVKIFPDLWDSLNEQQKSEFVSKLEGEIRDAVKDLQDLGVEREYSPEISKEDGQKIADLNFVRENKDRIPQTWSKLEMKAKEVAVEIKNDIKKEGLDRTLPS